mgnify:CR=1 FL=1
MSEETLLYLFTGFMDGGKTTMIKETLFVNGFANECGNFLIICCEDGEEESEENAGISEILLNIQIYTVFFNVYSQTVDTRFVQDGETIEDLPDYPVPEGKIFLVKKLLFLLFKLINNI